MGMLRLLITSCAYSDGSEAGPSTSGLTDVDIFSVDTPAGKINQTDNDQNRLACSASFSGP